jgi:hypothetical protein
MVQEKSRFIFCLDSVVFGYPPITSMEVVRGFFIGYSNAIPEFRLATDFENDLTKFCAAELNQEKISIYSLACDQFIELYRKYRQNVRIFEAVATLKDGRIFYGPVWGWKPKEGVFSISDTDNFLVELRFDDVVEAYERDRLDRSGFFKRIDLLEKARNEGWKDIH